MSAPSFILDTSVLLSAHKGCYPHDVVPGFWSVLTARLNDRTIISVDHVLREINSYHTPKDWVRQWAKKLPGSCFASTRTIRIAEVYAKLLQWVDAQDRLTVAAQREFARVADGWVIAYAARHGAIVVSTERSEPTSQKVIRIPDICSAHGVEHIDTLKMLRSVGAQFH